MILLISLVVVCILYYLLNWLYNEYKSNLENIDDHTVVTRLELSRKIKDLERKVNMNEQMINALWEEVAEKKLKEQKTKEKKSAKNEN